MKKIFLLSGAFVIFLSGFSQQWTSAQMDSANTAKDNSVLNDVEKATILYINLARLYPKDFITYELQDYVGPARYGNYLQNSSYKKSLLKELGSRTAIKPLRFDNSMYELAKCFSKELGNSGAVTHKRKKCPYGYLGECCSFGMDTGKDIAMQWLIDDNVPGTGHRVNCFNADYSVIAVSVHDHKSYRQCAVADFR